MMNDGADMRGKELRLLREMLGLSRREFGEIVGVTGRTTANWESEFTPIPAKAEAKLEDELDAFYGRVAEALRDNSVDGDDKAVAIAALAHNRQIKVR